LCNATELQFVRRVMRPAFLQEAHKQSTIKLANAKVYVLLHAHIYTRTHVRVYVCRYGLFHLRSLVCALSLAFIFSLPRSVMCSFTNTHSHTHTCRQTPRQTNKHTHTRIYTLFLSHTHTHTHKHTHTHTYAAVTISADFKANLAQLPDVDKIEAIELTFKDTGEPCGCVHVCVWNRERGRETETETGREK